MRGGAHRPNTDVSTSHSPRSRVRRGRRYARIGGVPDPVVIGVVDPAIGRGRLPRARRCSGGVARVRFFVDREIAFAATGQPGQARAVCGSASLDPALRSGLKRAGKR